MIASGESAPHNATIPSRRRIAGSPTRVDDVHEHSVDPSTDETGDCAPGSSDDHGNDDGQHRDAERNTRAVQDPREQIATERIGAEPVRRRRWLGASRGVQNERRVIRCEPRRKSAASAIAVIVAAARPPPDLS